VQPLKNFPAILRNPKVHHRVHNSPALVPILSQIDPVHPISLRYILILSTNVRLGLPSGLFPSGFPTNIMDSSLGLVMWELWWTKWHWSKFSTNTSVSPDNYHSTDCSTIITTYHPDLVQ
jgi:hypothetical protein